jgi:DNA-binding NarL/FixJ family response regulator
MPKLRVLVADDHERVRLAMVTWLNTEFEIVGAVANGKELIEAAVSLIPDVIVSDVSMPIVTGTQAMREIRSGWHEVPFVFVSADTFAASDWIEQGASAVVDKLDLGYDLAEAVRSAAKNEIYFSRSVPSPTLHSSSILGSCIFQDGKADLPFRQDRRDPLDMHISRGPRDSFGVD